MTLVGAGPGDPDLLTLKAARLIAGADIIFADRLAGPDVLKLARADAVIVSVGKSKGEHSVPQGEIHARMIAAARQGLDIVRLKGGDPFVFGRGGEEVEALRAAGVAVEVVPGVSSALGCAASAQIPLTHRDAAQAVTFVTGHAALGAEPDLDWAGLARPNQTVVVFMGLGTAQAIAARLIGAGRAPTTPVAVIENGTRPDEVRAFGRLGELVEVIARAGITGPALLVIGEVVALGRGYGAAAEPSTARPDESRDPGRRAVAATENDHLFIEEVTGLKAALGPDFRRDEREESGEPSRKPSLSDLWKLVT